MRASLVAVGLFIYAVGAAHASMTCPSVVGGDRADPVLYPFVKKVQQLYSSLGCDMTYLSLSHKRRLWALDRGHIQADLARADFVESELSRKVHRSEKPLGYMALSLWGQPNDTRPDILGYVNSVTPIDLDLKSVKKRTFDKVDYLVNAYNRGVIDYFVLPDTTVQYLIESKRIAVAPTRQKYLTAVPLYHYVSQDYSEFMTRFNARLTQEQSRYALRGMDGS